MRVENIEYPAQYIPTVMQRVQPRHLERTYGVKESEHENDSVKFLEALCRRMGRLLKGGEADLDGSAKQVLNVSVHVRNAQDTYTNLFRRIGSVESYLGSHHLRTSRVKTAVLSTSAVKASSAR